MLQQEGRQIMNPNQLLRIVDAYHRDKGIDPEVVFQAIEAALVSAARKQFGESAQIQVHIDRKTGEITATRDGEALDQETIGRIGAQTAKQVITQKIRAAEQAKLLEEYSGRKYQLVSGVVQRVERSITTVSLGDVEAILPRSEQIPGETHRPNERIRAIVYEVRPHGTRVKVVLSRTHPQLVRRLFEQEIPEIAEGIITIEAMAREPGYRSKVAVASTDPRVDCVGACVGVRGNRIKNIVDELAGERIDIVRWSKDPQVLIPNALQPAEVDQVLLCEMIGRAIVLVREDQLSLAIGRRGQNVRLASKLSGWDIEIMTPEELEEQIERAMAGFARLEGVSDELAEALVGQGYLSYDDLSVIEPDALCELGGLTAEEAARIIEQAERLAEEAEQAAEEERRRAQLAAATAPEAAEPAPGQEPSVAEAPPETSPGGMVPQEESPAAPADPAADQSPAEEADPSAAVQVSRQGEAEASAADATATEPSEDQATQPR